MGRIILTDDGITLYDSGVASSTPAAPPSPAQPTGNITDILFHRPEPPMPFPGAPASGPDCSGVLGPDCGQANNIASPGNPRTIAAQGKVIVTVNDTPLEGGTQYPLQVTVGGQKKTIITDGANVFDPVDTPVTVTASSAVVMQFRPA